MEFDIAEKVVWVVGRREGYNEVVDMLDESNSRDSFYFVDFVLGREV